MCFNYDNIVREYFEELKPLFINLLRKNFRLSYDDIMDIYTNVWIDVRHNILEGRVRPGTTWKAYILRMGFNQAAKECERRQLIPSFDDETFNREEFERQLSREKEADAPIYADPDMQALLATELSYIPQPCKNILNLFYQQQLSMSEIAAAMNYSNARTAITTKNRCMDKLKSRMLKSARLIGLIN